MTTTMIDWKHFTNDFTVDMMTAVFLGAIIMYIALIAFTRIFGLKSFSKMTGFDFINTIAIGNIFAMAIGTGDPKILIGIVIIGLLYLFNYLITYIQYKSNTAQKVLDNKPVLLMRNGELLKENIEQCKVTIDEIRGKLREANVLELSQVRAMVLETTGDVSVLHTKDDDVEVEDFLLADL
ncbi:DUF421 domain-containing protein [Gangjinia marincola]|uniref:DUF421 domain-containing protein n=1 Tax=Gangjinia marincola TaxID=578463 RepID=A0ABN1MDI8_9FLAO